MNLAKELAKVFSVIFLAVFLTSCGSGCIESDEFDNQYISVNSNPVVDGVDGVGDAQVAMWHDTGLMSDGGPIVFQLSGGWTPWYGNSDLGSNTQINALPACTFCYRNSQTNNCLCASGQTPTSEFGYSGTDCATNVAAQNDPAKCTCTTQYGSATDYGVYSFTLNKYDKYHNVLNPDAQNACKYTAGMGMYIGLFGNSGNVTPIRVYHTFSQNSVCDVERDSQGRCLDDGGFDVTKYIFSSANNQIFVKDDNAGNAGIDSNSSDDIMHARNEVIKLIIADSHYDDNYGSYNISFLSGIGNAADKGLLEFLVGLMEDKIMGVADSNGVRQGGVIQSMFYNITQNSGFILILQTSLGLYITFYGVAVLLGLAEVSKKELMNRSLKIALVIFFTSSTSWYWYDRIVVTFFKDSMDYVIAMLTSISDQNIDQTSGIITSQMNHSNAGSNATRFSYVDFIIKKMLSEAATKKILGLFFGVPLFGIVYILCIYALIAAFIYVMIFVGMIYVVAIIKLAFVLALGPIFIAFTLSSHTAEMFKKWVAFLGARSLEIIFTFLILYNFLVLIDQTFTSILSFRTCVDQLNLGLFSIPILKSTVSRSLITWFSYFIKMGALIFITKLVIDKVPSLAGSLITIGGVANKDSDGNPYGTSGFLAAGGLLGGMMSAAQQAGTSAFSYGAGKAAPLMQGATEIYRSAKNAVGSSVYGMLESSEKGRQFMNASGKMWSMLPSSPGAMYRNNIIDSAISKAQKEAKSKGLKDVAADSFVRNAVVNEMMNPKSANSNMANAPRASAFLMGMDLTTITQRLDQQLVNKPLVDFVKSESKKMKQEGIPANDMPQKLEERVTKWANENLSGGAASIQNILNNKGAVVDGVSWSGIGFRNMSELMRSQTEYSTAEARKAFAGDDKKEAAYLAHLESNQIRAQQERKQETENALSKTFNSVSNAVKDKAGSVLQAVNPFESLLAKDSIHDPARARKSFLREASNKDAARKGDIAETMIDFARSQTGSWLKHNQGSVLNPLNLFKSKSAIREEVREGERTGIHTYLRSAASEKEQESVRQSYAKREAAATRDFDRNKLKKEKEKTVADFDERRKMAKDRLGLVAVSSALKGSEEINKDLKDISLLKSESWGKFNEQSANYLRQGANYLSSEERFKANAELETKKQEDLKKVADKKIEARSLKNVLDEIESLKTPTKVDEALRRTKDSIMPLVGFNAEEERKAAAEKTTALTQKIGQQLRQEHKEAQLKDNQLRAEIFGAEANRVFNDLNLMRAGGASTEELFRFAEYESKKLSSDKQTKLEKNGGLLILSEGLAEIDGSSLFEKEARLKYFEDRFGQAKVNNLTGGDSAANMLVGADASAIENIVSGDVLAENIVGSHPDGVALDAARTPSKAEEQIVELEKQLTDLEKKFDRGMNLEEARESSLTLREILEQAYSDLKDALSPTELAQVMSEILNYELELARKIDKLLKEQQENNEQLLAEDPSNIVALEANKKISDERNSLQRASQKNHQDWSEYQAIQGITTAEMTYQDRLDTVIADGQYRRN